MWKSIYRKHYSDTSVFINDFLDFLENQLGWTVYDDQSSASSYRVYTTTGENGDREPAFFKVSWNSSRLYVRGYRYWDNANHNGVGSAYVQSNGYLNISNDMFIWLFGDKDSVWVVSKRGSTYDTIGFGYVEHKFRTVSTKLTANANSGDNVQIAVKDTTGFYPRRYRIYDPSNGNIDTVKVISVDDGTHLTIENLPRNYTNGSYIAELAMASFLFFVNDYNEVSLFDDMYASGTGNGDRGGYWAYYMRSGSDMGIPDYLTGEYYSLPAMIVDSEHNTQWFGYFETNVRGANRSFSPETVLTFGRQDNGTTDQDNTGNTLVDSSKNWATNAWVGKFLVITSGEGKGEYHKITGNDATSITIQENWIVNPTNGTTYEIVDEVWLTVTTNQGLILRL